VDQPRLEAGAHVGTRPSETSSVSLEFFSPPHSASVKVFWPPHIDQQRCALTGKIRFSSLTPLSYSNRCPCPPLLRPWIDITLGGFRWSAPLLWHSCQAIPDALFSPPARFCSPYPFRPSVVVDRPFSVQQILFPKVPEFSKFFGIASIPFEFLIALLSPLLRILLVPVGKAFPLGES